MEIEEAFVIDDQHRGEFAATAVDRALQVDQVLLDSAAALDQLVGVQPAALLQPLDLDKQVMPQIAEPALAHVTRKKARDGDRDVD